ncbi:MAG: UvrD-helicase domain-containing protein [Thermodesulfobacteriota bacterium]
MTDERVMDLRVPDEAARLRAIDPAGSFIVQAPAGSGKTELLKQRFLSLLSTVEDPGEILAITFTRKAAGEMSERILKALADAGSGREPGDDNDRRSLELAARALARDSALGWGILENPSRLKVMTIDSLGAALARQMPLLSRLAAGPVVTDTPGELYAEAAERTIALAELDTPEGRAARLALAHFDNSIRALATRIEVMLEKRDQWLRHISGARGGGGGGGGASLRARLEGSLTRIIEDGLKAAAGALPARLAGGIVAAARFAAANLAASGSASPITALQEIKAMPGGGAEDLPPWRSIAELLLTKEGEPRKPRGVNVRLGFPNVKSGDGAAIKEDFKCLLEELSGEAAFVEALAEVRELPPPRYPDRDWEVLESILRLLPAAVARLEEVFAEHGAVDFQALASAALAALGPDDDPTDLMLAMDTRLRHILIDEYQDTSRTQYELVRALTRGWEPGDGRTLFIVGDPMQSIYLFREAEVGLFLDARARGIGGVELTPLALTSNFRSQKSIVRWVNESLPGAFPSVEDRFTGAVPYALSEAVREEMERVDPEVRVFLERDDAREAGEVADIVQRTPPGESVAVLVRNRPHLTEIIRVFKEREIPFVSKEIDPLQASTVVRDLTSLVRALERPLDRTAWLSVLRAPWCGLTLGDLHALCRGDATAPLWRLLRDPKRLAGLSADGRARLEGAAEKLERALAMRGRVPVRELVEGLWIDLDGPACLTDPSEAANASVFLDLVESTDRAGRVHTVEMLEERTAGLYASPSPPPSGRGGGGGAVEVMTIHKAKGLEFDHVILPGLGRRPKNSTGELLLWVERGDDLLLAPIESRTAREKDPICRYIRRVNRTREELEKTRLLYVAATRARKRLHIFGHVPGSGSADRASLLDSLSHRLGTHIELEGVAAGARPPGPDARAAGAAGRRLCRRWSPPAPKPAVETGQVEAPSPEKAEPEFFWAGPAARHLGVVVHACLCGIAREGVGRWDAGRVAGQAQRISTMLRAEGLSSAEAARYARRAVEIITTAVTEPRGRWALGGHAEAEVELALTMRADRAVVRVQIDRTFVDEEGARWVIDYKTGSHEGGSLEDFMASERKRYEPQLEGYARALAAGGEKRRIRKGLYYPAIPAWVEWD